MIRVVVADDHSVVRAGLRTVLEATGEIEVVGEAGDGETAVELVRASSPDVVLVDVTMPGMTGLELARVLRRGPDAVTVLVVSMHDNPGYVLEAMRSGAAGYVLKDAEPQTLRTAVRTVHEGGRYLPPELAARLGAALAEESEASARERLLRTLSERETEVLVRVAEGRTSREIGEELGISHRTVEAHRESVMSKLEIRTVAGLTRFVIETGIAEG